MARRLYNPRMTSLRHGFEDPGDVQDTRLVVDTIPTLAWSARPDGSAEFFNQRWLVYTGLSAKQALDWGWEVAIHPDVGCAYCIDMHSEDARSEGETEQRPYALNVWRETPFFTARERAALTWTEALTLITEGHVPDDIYELAKQSFSNEELVNLTLAVITINGWNRLAISFRSVPGAYQPGMRSKVTSK